MLVVDQWAQRWGIPAQAVAELKESLTYQAPLGRDPRAVTEADVQALCQIEASKFNSFLMRNNNGAWTDHENNRTIRYGLGNDSKRINDKRKSSDLIGITSVIVEQHHVGRVFGIFTAAEIKKPGWHQIPSDKRAEAQDTFHKFVRAYGGLAGFCRSTDDYRQLVAKGYGK